MTGVADLPLCQTLPAPVAFEQDGGDALCEAPLHTAAARLGRGWLGDNSTHFSWTGTSAGRARTYCIIQPLRGLKIADIDKAFNLLRAFGSVRGEGSGCHLVTPQERSQSFQWNFMSNIGTESRK